MCTDTFKEIAAGLFICSVLALCTALFLTTLDGVACGPAAHPSPALAARSGQFTPIGTADPSETSGVGSAVLTMTGADR